MQAVVRILVALLALAGATSAAFAAFFVQEALAAGEKQVCQKFHVSTMDEVLTLSEAFVAAQLSSPREAEAFNAATRSCHSMTPRSPRSSPWFRSSRLRAQPSSSMSAAAVFN